MFYKSIVLPVLLVIVALLSAESRSFANDLSSYPEYRDGRVAVQYRYVYPRGYRIIRPRVYYSAPAYRYPAYVYPRTPNMMYYGPSVRVTYGPWVYAY